MPKPRQMLEIKLQADQEHVFQVAEELSRQSPEARAEWLAQVPEAQAAAVFKFMNPAYQVEILAKLSRQQALRLVELLAPDDRARLSGLASHGRLSRPLPPVP